MTKAIWKVGPFQLGVPLITMGKPVACDGKDGEFHVWCEVDPAWKDLPNTKEADSQVDWCKLMFVATGTGYDGNYIASVPSHEWHCIEVKG